MRQFLRNLYLTRISFGLAAVLLLCAANSLAQPPLVYTVENTGAGLSPTATLPAWASLPIIRQLPDPFVFFNGTRDTSWAAFEQHRQEWIAALQQYEQGPKPSCTGTSADAVLGVPYVCSVTASYTDDVGQSLHPDSRYHGDWGAEWNPNAIAFRGNCHSNSFRNICTTNSKRGWNVWSRTSQWVAVDNGYGRGYRELASHRVQRND